MLCDLWLMLRISQKVVELACLPSCPTLSLVTGLPAALDRESCLIPDQDVTRISLWAFQSVFISYRASYTRGSFWDLWTSKALEQVRTFTLRFFNSKMAVLRI